MSIRALTWSYGLRGLTATEKAVLNNLAWHHNGRTGQCNPSTKLIAAESGLGRSTVDKALASLAAKGLIDIVHDTSLGRFLTLAITEPDALQESNDALCQSTPNKELEFNPKEPRERHVRANTPSPAPKRMSDEMLTYAQSQGLSEDQIRREWDRLRNRRLDEGRMSHDWAAAWRNWLMSARSAPSSAPPTIPVVAMPPLHVELPDGEIPRPVAECVKLMIRPDFAGEKRLLGSYEEYEIAQARKIVYTARKRQRATIT